MQQALERQIVFEDHKEAYALLGDRDEFLQVFRENFDCQFISRGEQLEILGEAAEVKMAATLVEELQYLYRQGTTITMHEVRYGIGLVRGGKGEALHTLFGDTILVTARGRHVRPKTLGQRLYLDTIRHNSITFGIGPAGTGKTYLAVVMAVAALRNKEVRRIILTRPAVEAGERLGFLPGDLQDKVDPYLRPLYDALFEIMGPEAFERNMEKGFIEVAPLAYMRGRTLENAYIILDEAQNTTPAQMKMFLTRFGAGSKVIVTGDVTQIDLPSGKRSGLIEAQRVLKGIKGIDFIEFDYSDVVRHRLVQRIIEAYEKYDQTRAAHQESEADSEEKDAPRRRKHHDHH